MGYSVTVRRIVGVKDNAIASGERWLKKVDFSDRDNKPGVGVEPT